MKPFMEQLFDFCSSVRTQYGEAPVQMTLNAKLFERVMQEWDDVLVNEQGTSTARTSMTIWMGGWNILLIKAKELKQPDSSNVSYIKKDHLGLCTKCESEEATTVLCVDLILCDKCVIKQSGPVALPKAQDDLPPQ